MKDDEFTPILNAITTAQEKMYEAIGDSGREIGLHGLSNGIKAAIARDLHWRFDIGEAELFILLDASPLDVEDWIAWTELPYRCACGEVVTLAFRNRDAKRRSKFGAVICEKCRYREAMADHEEKWAAIKAKRLAELRAMPYPEYLQTTEWKARRDQQVEADGGACRLCGCPDHLNVHHRTYDRLGEEAPLDLITLCYACHQNFHENRQLSNGPAPPGSTGDDGVTP